ncbi:MAG TPA: transketolase [Candidatus Baltobacteraceae bacterium]|nr:transketolase [Candidatus Baltobacteraceae bacterium]
MNLAETGVPLDSRSKHLRSLVIDGLSAGRGHVGSSLSLIEIIRVLYDDVLNVRPAEPEWPDRDRFILSKGHGCLGLYAVLADHGFFPVAELKTFCKPGALLGGHADAHIPGVEASTGALGHGLPIGVGAALAARLRKRESRVFVVMGDGEVNEGSVWEAALHASKHMLDNLIAIVDYNKLQSYGRIEDVLPLEPLADKWRAFGFAVREVDGHDVNALGETFAALPFEKGKPNAVIAHTLKGRGISFAELDATWHHKSTVDAVMIERLRAALEQG